MGAQRPWLNRLKPFLDRGNAGREVLAGKEERDSGSEVVGAEVGEGCCFGVEDGFEGCAEGETGHGGFDGQRRGWGEVGGLGGRGCHGT